MKRIATAVLLCLVLTLTLVLPIYAAATGPTTLLLDAVTSPTDTAWQDVFNKKKVRFRIWSPSGASTSTVLVQVRSSDASPAYTIRTYTDITAAGQYYSVPRTFQARVSITVLSLSNISVEKEVYSE